jgi:hypothetical protein
MKIQDLNQAEIKWLGQMQEVGRLLHHMYVGPLDSLPDLQALDAIWVRWQSDKSSERPDPNTVVNALGLCYGQHLVNRLGFRWAVVTDEHGTELACIAQPGDATVFPANGTAKRLGQGPSPFFADLFSQVEARVQSLRGKKPA